MYNFRSEPLTNTLGLKGTGQVGLYVNDVLTYYFYQTSLGGVQPTMSDRWVVEAIPVEMEVSVQVFTDVKGIDTTDRNNVDWMSIRSTLEQLSIGALMQLTQDWHESGLAEKYFQDNLIYRVYGRLPSGIWRGFTPTSGDDSIVTISNFELPTYRAAPINTPLVRDLYKLNLTTVGIEELIVVQGPDLLGRLHVSNNVVIIKQTADGSTQTDSILPVDVGVRGK